MDKAPFELNGRQRALVEALSQKDTRLAEMYLSALVVLRDGDNPDRFAQACYSLRELMEKIPRWYAAVPAAEQVPRMGDKVGDLAKQWRRARTGSNTFTAGGWRGTIDPPLEDALRAIDEFFAWLEKDRPMRKERTAGMFRKLDPMRLPLPSKIEQLRVEEWSSCREYFEDVAHHNIMTAPEDIGKWLYFLEGFLLDLIRPRTFEKHEEIDTIIQHGEGNANPR